jgi:hypothetical protein
MRARRAFAISRAFAAAPLRRFPELLVLQELRDKMRLAAVAAVAVVFRLARLELGRVYPSTVERRLPLLSTCPFRFRRSSSRRPGLLLLLFPPAAVAVGVVRAYSH